jgi:hypothetical protein
MSARARSKHERRGKYKIITMTLDWIPQGHTYNFVDELGPHEVNVIGLLAYIEDGRFYEIRPIDVKGTDGAGLDHALSDEIYAVLGVKKR